MPMTSTSKTRTSKLAITTESGDPEREDDSKDPGVNPPTSGDSGGSGH